LNRPSDGGADLFFLQALKMRGNASGPQLQHHRGLVSVKPFYRAISSTSNSFDGFHFGTPRSKEVRHRFCGRRQGSRAWSVNFEVALVTTLLTPQVAVRI
jgi:hypothetical protein